MSYRSEKEKRNAEIVKLRKEGKTYQYLGDMFDITRQNVQRICAKAAKQELLRKSDPFKSALSWRTKKALVEIYGRPLPNPKKIAKAGAIKLELADGIGPKSMQELADALHQNGYITDPKSWLAGRLKTRGDS